MDQGKKGAKTLSCQVCKIDFNSHADYALHEFSKKHCDNLIRLAKQKPIVSKQKVKAQPPPVEKEPPKINSVTHTGSFAKYGYFVPGEIYASAETSKEFNTDYDPYLQKFAENPYKEKPAPPPVIEQPIYNSVTSFSKKKKKKTKTCQVCNVTLSTVPEYEAHMKSLQHIWNLKVTGMGVSAHFVKASSDLHTTDVNEEPKPSPPTDQQIPVLTTAAAAAATTTTVTTNTVNSTSGPFPLLYCSDCELLLNSPQQYNAHIAGKLHLECAQRKAELKAKKEKLETPSPDQLYCFSCKISLNNLFQYNEHKNGKKHKTKCRNLIRKGITIPPEERVPGIPLPNPKGPVVYPELYQKLVLEKQTEGESKSVLSQSELQKNSGSENFNCITQLQNDLNNADSGIVNQDVYRFNENEERNIQYCVSDGNQDGNSITGAKISNLENAKVIFHKNQTNSDTSVSATKPQIDCLSHKDTSRDSLSSAGNSDIGGSKSEIIILTNNTPVKCSICSESFQWQYHLDGHLGTEDHLKKILELKLNGRSESDILDMLFSDRNVIKPSDLGKLMCSICNVTADNSVEFHQHLNSMVHKYTLKDYKMKRTLEVKQIVAVNEENLYACRLCKESWLSLLEYTQHLHFIKHKSLQRAQRSKAVLAKRKSLYIQKPKLNLKKRNMSLMRVKSGKNPGVRTKISGVAVDLNSGTLAPVPNLETLESNIDQMKNVNIGITEKQTDSIATDEIKESTVKKKHKMVKSNRKTLPNHRSAPYHDNRSQLIPSGNMIPPLMSSPPFPPRFPRLRYAPPHRDWVPFSSPHPSTFRPFCDRPAVRNPYFRPPWFQRPPWPRFS